MPIFAETERTLCCPTVSSPARTRNLGMVILLAVTLESASLGAGQQCAAVTVARAGHAPQTASCRAPAVFRVERGPLRRFVFRRGRCCRPSVCVPASPTAQSISSDAVFAEAVAMAQQIPSAAGRSETLIDIAKAQVQAGFKEQGRHTFAAAFVAARQHYETKRAANLAQDVCLRKIAEAQAQAGFLADAIATSARICDDWRKSFTSWEEWSYRNQARNLCEALPHDGRIESQRCRALRAIAVAQTCADQREQARSTFADALAAAKQVGMPSEPNIAPAEWEYVAIASEELKVGLLDDAVALLNELTWPDTKVVVLCKIACEQARQGQTEQAKHSFRAAAACAAQLQDSLRWRAILEIATAQAEAQMAAQAAQSFQEANALTALYDPEVSLPASGFYWRLPSTRWQAILEVAAAQTKAKMTAEAAHTLREAVTAVTKPNVTRRCEGLAQIAAAQAKAGMAKEAQATFAAAMAAARPVRLPDGGGNGASRIAGSRTVIRYGGGLFASLGAGRGSPDADAGLTNVLMIAGVQQGERLYDDALASLRADRTALAENGSLSIRLDLAEIMIYARMGQFAQALAQTRRLPKEFRSGCLFFIAAQQAAAGDGKAASALLKETDQDHRSVPHVLKTLFAERRCGDFYSDWPMPYAYKEATSIHQVALALANAGQFSEAMALARRLDFDDHQSMLTLVDLVACEIEAQHAPQALVAIAAAKDAVRKHTEAGCQADLLARIARLEAQGGWTDDARRTFAEAGLASQRAALPTDDPDDAVAACLHRLVTAQIGAGFLAEAAESCRAVEESEAQAGLLAQLKAAREWPQKEAGYKEAFAQALRDPEAAARTTLDPLIRDAVIANLAKAGRASEALAIARKIGERSERMRALRQIAAAQAEAKHSAALRQTIAEWWSAARQIEDPLGRESELQEITGCLADLEMERELDQVFRERIDAAVQMEARGTRFLDRSPHEPQSVFTSIAIDQAQRGRTADALATTRRIKNAHARFVALNDILTWTELPVDEIRRICAAILTTGRQNTGDRMEELSSVALHQADAGLTKEAAETLAELLRIARTETDLTQRVWGLRQAADIRTAISIDSGKRFRPARDDLNSRIRPIYQEALAAARKIEDEEDREEAFVMLARSQVRAGMLTEATELTRQLERHADRTDPFLSIAQAQPDDGLALQALAEAFVAAKAIKEYWGVAQQRSAIEAAVRRSRSPKFDENAGEFVARTMNSSKVFMTAALGMARGMDCERKERAEALCDIATNQHTLGRKDEARCTFAEALAEARKEETASKKAKTLKNIAVKLAEIEKESGSP